MLELRKPQVQEIVKSAPLPPPAAVPLTRGTIIEPNADTDSKSRPPARTKERVNVNVPLREGDGRRRRQIAQTEVAPEPSEPAKPLVVKLLTDDPNIVIYWLIDNTGGAL